MAALDDSGAPASPTHPELKHIRPSWTPARGLRIRRRAGEPKLDETSVTARPFRTVAKPPGGSTNRNCHEPIVKWIGAATFSLPTLTFPRLATSML